MEQSHFPSGTTEAADFAQGGLTDTSPLSRLIQQPHLSRLDDGADGSRLGSTLQDGAAATDARRPTSAMSQSNTLTPSRGGTLKKKQSLSRRGSLKRSTSMKSIGAGDVRDRGKRADAEDDEMNSVFFIPVPTHGNPTDILANRFQAWRKVLKDLITYFRDIQKSYESRSKSLLTLSNVINTTTPPSMFLAEGGISDATQILRDYNKQALAEGNKAKNIEDDVIAQLAGLRSDLQQKVKEIKNLSGDFKNAVDKETEGTRKAVRNLQEVLETIDSASSGKSDPYLAFLNLESSGRELESIVVGEIQKAYNAYAGILKREADEAYDAADRLRSGPITMAKDHEWDSFIDNNENFIDPKVPVRRVEHIHYPGKEHPAAAEVRAGMLERKSKYLKSYTPGWYVLSPTHLHEFKSADRLNTQTPMMSLYLPEQKLGSRSGADSSSHKFMLKGRQTGPMHRGHAWVFRAESRDTMLAWFEDIKNLTEKTGEERNAFVRAVLCNGFAREPADVPTGPPAEAPATSGASSDDSDIVATASALPGSDVRNRQSDHPARDNENTTASDDFPGGVTRKASTREKHNPTAQTLDYPGLQEQPAMHGSTRHIPARQAATHPGPAHDGTGSRAISPGDVATSSRYDSYIPIAQKAEYNNLLVEKGPYETSQQGLVAGEIESEGAPDVSRATSHHGTHVPITHQTEYFGFPVIPAIPELEQQISAPQAPHQQSSIQKPPTREVSTRPGVEYNDQSVQVQGISSDGPGEVSHGGPQHQPQTAPDPKPLSYESVRHDSIYGDWMGPKATGVVAAKAAPRPHQHDLVEPAEQQKQASQQPQSEPANFDDTTSAPTELPTVLSPRSSPRTKGLGIDAFDASTEPDISRTIPATPKANATGTDTYLASDVRSRSDTNMAPHPQAAGPVPPPRESEPSRPLAAGEDTPPRPLSHFHIPGEFPPTPAAG
ncbi:Pleckstrin homology-like domain [Lasallia pustulata]|uniref:Pleckstrin homology-like domain n=1 Tax=Lasallia pustulata TaxID=136370 RepID=A0A1W5D274_9LECA|nr:Pleckstrin homology-like domain [Lasallia pustulata]